MEQAFWLINMDKELAWPVDGRSDDLLRLNFHNHLAGVNHELLTVAQLRKK